jgi:hypothetical protein
MMCCAGNDLTEADVNGCCPVCGEPTCDGEAIVICYYSTVICDECGSAPCEGFC